MHIESRSTRNSRLFWLVAAFALLCVSPAAFADPCPGSDTCPVGVTTGAVEATAVEVEWTEPDGVVGNYTITSQPPAPNQPIYVTNGNPDNLQDHIVYGLKAGVAYTFKVCSQPANSCVSTAPVTTVAQQQNNDTPTPNFTSVNTSEDQNGIYIHLQWTAGVAYDFYQVNWTALRPWAEGQQQSSQLQSGSTAGSWTLPGPLHPNETYDVEVQGCINVTWHSSCSAWADATITTPNPPNCPAPSQWDNTRLQCIIVAMICGTSAQPCASQPPHGLAATVKASEILISWSLPSGLPATVVREAAVTRTPPWPNNVSTITVGPQNPTSLTDVLAVSGIAYNYQVCLVYSQSPPIFQPASNCATTSGQIPAPSCGSAADPCKSEPPQNLRFAVANRALVVSWSLPKAVPSSAIAQSTVTRTPPWPAKGEPKTTNLTSLTDDLAEPGTSYTYDVCLEYLQTPKVYQPTRVCVTASGEVPCLGGLVPLGGKCVPGRVNLPGPTASPEPTVSPKPKPSPRATVK